MNLKDEITAAIRAISNAYGGDDEYFLYEYIAAQLLAWEHDLEHLLNCYKDVASAIPTQACQQAANSKSAVNDEPAIQF